MIKLVSALPAADYDIVAMTDQVRRHFELLGGIGAFVSPGLRVLIKVNLLMGRDPAAVTTTHPALVEAIASVVQEAGGIVTIADSPGGPYTKALLERAYRASGLTDAAQRSGAALNYSLDSVQVPFAAGLTCRVFELISPWAEADLVISACKLKTHGMTGYTGAVKNNFGLIPGLQKPELHFRFRELEDFCSMLIDVALCAAPQLTFMDAVDCMEGNGPSGGTPRYLGLTLCSRSPFALDLLASHLIGFAPHELPTIRQSIARGLCPESADLLQVLGCDVVPYRCSFQRAGTARLDFSSHVPRFLSKLGTLLLTPTPAIDKRKCIGCGECAVSCPPRAILIRNGRAYIDHDKCIRCFCCHELCRERAVDIKKNILTYF